MNRNHQKDLLLLLLSVCDDEVDMSCVLTEQKESLLGDDDEMKKRLKIPSSHEEKRTEGRSDEQEKSC